MKRNLPVIGAALQIEHLADFSDWLIEGQRDLEIQNSVPADFLEADWSESVAHFRSVMGGYSGRCGIHGPFINLSVAAKDRVVRQRSADLFKKGLEFCQEIGGSHMVLHSPLDSFGDPFAPYLRNGKFKEALANSHATLETVLPLAEAAGVTMVIETIRDKNPQHLIQLVESFDSPHVQLSIDTGHAFIAHHDGGATPDAWARQAGSLLKHVHLQGCDGLADRHWAPGDGSINWYAFFEAINELEEQPRLLLEIKNPDLVMRGFDWLKNQGFGA